MWLLPGTRTTLTTKLALLVIGAAGIAWQPAAARAQGAVHIRGLIGPALAEGLALLVGVASVDASAPGPAKAQAQDSPREQASSDKSDDITAQTIPLGFVFDSPAEGANEFFKHHKGGKPSSEVTAWNIFASNLVAANLPPGPQTYTLAVAHIAIHDALNAIDPRYEPYEFAGPAPGASVAAAVAAAAHDTLVKLVPQAAAAVEAEYEVALSSIPDGAAKDAGIETGQAAAAAILARRSSDDLLAAIKKPYTPGPANPGVYQPTPPLNIVLLAGWSELPPFALTSASQFRSLAPASVKSFRYTIDYKEVKAVGSADSTTRTAEQTETARFWYDVAAKEWNFAAQKGLADVSADEWRAARTLAVLNISLADAVIATFDTKFHYNYWRPITAIRAGDHDGNSATQGDPSWEPLCVTPPFPEYASTHAATAVAAAGALALELGDRHTFTVASPNGTSRTYKRFSAAAYEKGISRIYCGIHFRTAMNMGFMQGGLIAYYVDKNLLRPLDH